MSNNSDSFAGKLKDSLYWWLGYRHSFNINDEYKLELLYIDREHQSVKIKITNLKSKETHSTELSDV